MVRWPRKSRLKRLANAVLARIRRRPTSTPASRPRACHVVATTEGATWVGEQLRDLRDGYGYDVAAVVSGPSGGLVDRLRAERIPVHVAEFTLFGIGDLFILPRNVLRLARLFQRERFDVVQTHLFHSMIIGRVAAWLADVPVRLTLGAAPFSLEAYTPRWIDRATFWMDTLLIGSCRYTLQLYRALGVRAERLALVYSGPAERVFDPAALPSAGIRRALGWP